MLRLDRAWLSQNTRRCYGAAALQRTTHSTKQSPLPRHRVLIANRGEPAVRFIRAAGEYAGAVIETVALYTSSDENSRYVREATLAVRLPVTSPEVNAYLDPQALIAAARASQSNAIWLGWGFLSENADFAALCEQAGLLLLGPTADSMRELGDKIRSKTLAAKVGVPIVPWLLLDDGVEPNAADIVAQLGLPLIVKASAGGGGRGVRPVHAETELAEAIRSARNEAIKAFGDGRLYIERLLIKPRHLEVQVLGDGRGEVRTFGVRDCTLQRRHQKVIEECPGPRTSPAIATALEAHAARLAAAVNYRGVGTIEFLYIESSNEAFFIEANTRLQVEHTITELVYGIDLVKCQIDVALYQRLPARGEPRGYAVEARLCAESAERDFAPTPGKLVSLDFAAGPGVRIDTSVHEGDRVSASFDSMIAKVIAYGSDRTEALRRLSRALSDTTVVMEGGQSNKSLLLTLCEHPAVQRGDVHTRWLDEAVAELCAPSFDAVPAIAAAIICQREQDELHLANFHTALARGVPQRVERAGAQNIELDWQGKKVSLSVATAGPRTYMVSPSEVAEGDELSVVRAIEWTQDGQYRARMSIEQRQYAINFCQHGHELIVEVDGYEARLTRSEGGAIRAPAPSVLSKLMVKPGERVKAGQVLALLEAMKLEMPLRSPADGVVKTIEALENTQVPAGAVLMRLEDQGGASTAAPLKWLVEEPESAPCRTLAEVLSNPSGRKARRFVSELERILRRELLGLDVLPAEHRFAARVWREAASATSELALKRFLQSLLPLIIWRAELERLFSTEHLLASDARRAQTFEQAFYDFARQYRRGPSVAPTDYRPHLSKAMEHYPIAWSSIDASEETILDASFANDVRFVLHRIACAVRGKGSAKNTDALLGSILALFEKNQNDDHPEANSELQAKLYDALLHLSAARQTTAPALSDAMKDARFLLFRSARSASISPAAPPIAEQRLRGVGIKLVSDNHGVAVWRIAPTQAHQPNEVRLVVSLALQEAKHLADAFLSAMVALRSALRQEDPRRVTTGHRVEITLQEPRAFNRHEALVLARRLRLTADGEGLESVVVHARAPEAVTGHSVVITNPTGQRISVSVVEGSSAQTDEVLGFATTSASERRLAEAKRRRLPYPYAIVRMLLSIDEPYASAGSFSEYDLDESGQAVPVERPPGLNTCSVVFGLVTHQVGATTQARVLVMSDAMLDMGALSAPECQRLLAALQLAHDRRLPVEWLPVSSGARIAMNSGTENLDWTARVLRRIVELTQAGLTINVIVDGVNVGAQSYFNAEATMLQHCRGVLIMTGRGTMVLTGKRALDYSGSVSAEDERGIGGFDRVMGPNGEAHYFARTLHEAYRLLFELYAQASSKEAATLDPIERNAMLDAYPNAAHGFTTVGDIFSPSHNKERKKPFEVRAVMHAVRDRRSAFLERHAAMRNAEGAVVAETFLGGRAVTMIGFESKPVKRLGFVPEDGPDSFSGGTLFPAASKKVARAINAASGHKPVVILANLSGFDGSPESMRRLQLEYGAEIGRAVVNFRGRIVFCVIGRYHGGAYVVFSKALNENLIALAIEGSYASVIGGAPAAAVVFSREVRARALADERIRSLGGTVDEREFARVLAEHQGQLAKEFDAIHSIERAKAQGSIDRIISPDQLRRELCEAVRQPI